MSITPLLYNPQERRLRSGLRLVIQTGFYYLINIVLYAALAAGYFMVESSMGAGVDVEISPGFLLVTALITGFVVLLSVWLAARFLDHRPCTDFGLSLDRAWWGDLLFGLLLGGVLMAGIFGVEWGMGWIRVTEAMGLGGQPILWEALAAPLILYIAVGIYEEILFRGYRLRNLAEGVGALGSNPRWGVVAAWILSSIWFGLAHRNNPNASLISNINLALAGLFLGLGYIYTGRLGLSIGVHISWNFFQGNVFGFPVSGTRIFPASLIAVTQDGPSLWTGGAFGPEAGLLGIAAMLIGSLLILAWIQWRHGRVALYTPAAFYSAPHAGGSLSSVESS